MEGIQLDLLPPGDRIIDRMIAALGRKDPRAHDVVEAICRRVGEPALDLLVTVAIGNGKRVAHRVGILEMIKRLGLPLDFDKGTKLASLMTSRSAAVRQKTMEVFDAVGGSRIVACFLQFVRQMQSGSTGLPSPASRSCDWTSCPDPVPFVFKSVSADMKDR